MGRALRPLALVALAACTSTAGLAGGVVVQDDAGPTPDGGADAGADSSPAPVDARAETPDVDADAACSSDLKTDSKNCGSCGHDCLGGTCSNGACLPVVAALTGDAGADEALAIDGAGTIFWDTFGTGAIVHAGSVIANASPNGPSGIVVHDGQLFWANYGVGSITRAALDGGQPVDVVGAIGNPGCFDFDDKGRIYVSDFDGGRVLLVDGAIVTVILTGLAKPWGVAVSGSQLYVSEYGGGAILQAALDGASAKRIVNGEDHPACMAVDGSSLFWVDSTASGGVRRMDLSTGTVAWVATGGAQLGIALDAKSVYWADATGGKIFRLAR